MARWVKNKWGTTGRRPKYGAGSHEEQHRLLTGSRRRICAAAGCGEPCTVGAHVIKAHGNAGRQEHLVLFCHAHNQEREAIRLKASARLARAN